MKTNYFLFGVVISFTIASMFQHWFLMIETSNKDQHTALGTMTTPVTLPHTTPFTLEKAASAPSTAIPPSSLSLPPQIVPNQVTETRLHAAQRFPIKRSERLQEKEPGSRLTLAAIKNSCEHRSWLLKYAKLHREIMAGERAVSDTRFLIVRPHERAGLGNRVRAIFGALSLAVLTRRALLLDFGPRTNDTEAGLLLPGSFDWRLPAKEWPHLWAPYEESAPLPPPATATNAVEASGVGSRVGSGGGKMRKLKQEGVAIVYHNRESFFRTAGAPELSWPKARALVVDSQNHDMSKALLTNPKLASLVAGAGFDLGGKDEVRTWHSCALRALFSRPSPQLSLAVCESTPKAQTGEPLVPRAVVTTRPKTHPRRALVALHVRSEGKHQGDIAHSPLWNATVAAFVACAQLSEATTLSALASFVNNHCGITGSGTGDAEACEEASALVQDRPVWFVLADRPELVEKVQLMARREGRDVVAVADDSVRVHSGLLSGGDRAMGTAFGPLQELIVAGSSLSLVGSAGSSFSELLASFLGVVEESGVQSDEDLATKVLIRTPFIKSYQGAGLKPEEALMFCQEAAKRLTVVDNVKAEKAVGVAEAHVSRVLTSRRFVSCA